MSTASSPTGPRRDGADVGADDDQRGDRRQPGVVDARVARHDDRRPGRAALGDPRGHAQAKEQQNAIGAPTPCRTGPSSRRRRSLAAAARAYSGIALADRHRPLFNVTISNVPGPPFPLYSAGARMVANYPMGPIIDGAGLNMTVMSYMDQLDFGLVTCPELIPDAWVIANGLSDALDELRKRAEAPAKKAPAAKKAKSTAKRPTTNGA